VTDIHSNTNTCQQKVTVTDDENPTIADCPGDITVNADAGSCSAVVTWTPPSADDNCGVQSFTSDYDPGDTFPGGDTLVTYTATDVYGNISTCSFTVTVLGYNDLVVSVEVQGLAIPVTRCIRFSFYAGGTPVVLEKELDFDAVGKAENVTFNDLPCSAAGYTCVLAEDTLHTLQVQLVPGLDSGAYTASFMGTDKLTTADYYDDNLIDIADFGVYIAQWGACYDSDNDGTCDGDTPCNRFAQNHHADANGDGILDVTDFNWISSNFLAVGDPDCGAPPLPALPRTSITVAEMRANGVQGAWKADLNNDGVIDLTDVELFLSGVLPPEPKEVVPDQPNGNGVPAGVSGRARVGLD
jgi:hypothetical protein